MAIFKLVEGLTYAALAAADLRLKLNHIATIDAAGLIALCGNDAKALGTIFEVGDEGEPVSVQMGGIAKVVASAAIAAGARVACDANGQAKTGTTNPLGIALAAAGAANVVIPVALVN